MNARTYISASEQEALNNVYWIGGGSGAGKSTIAQRIADRHDMRLYSTDNAMADHSNRCSPTRCPYLESFKEMSMDDRWVNRSPEIMLDTFHWFRGEGFEFILEDLRSISPYERIIVEGFRLLPDLVKPLLNKVNQGIWLLPTPEFRISAFKSRGTLWAIAERTSNPDRALANLLERDRLFTKRLEVSARIYDVPMIAVNPLLSEDVLVDRVEVHFGLVQKNL